MARTFYEREARVGNRRSMTARITQWFLAAPIEDCRTVLEVIKAIVEGRGGGGRFPVNDDLLDTPPVKARRGRKPKAAETETA